MQPQGFSKDCRAGGITGHSHRQTITSAGLVTVWNSEFSSLRNDDTLHSVIPYIWVMNDACISASYLLSPWFLPLLRKNADSTCQDLWFPLWCSCLIFWHRLTGNMAQSHSPVSGGICHSLTPGLQAIGNIIGSNVMQCDIILYM